MGNRNRKSKKNISLKTRILTGIILFLILLVGGYLGIAAYYHNSFPVGTFVNGIYCTGMSREEAADLLEAQYQFMGASVFLGEGPVLKMEPGDLTIKADFHPALSGKNDLLQSLRWPFLFRQWATKGGIFLSATPVLTVDHLMVEKWFYGTPYVKEQRETERTIRLEFEQDQGYSLINTKEHVLQDEVALESICEALEKGETIIDLSSMRESCFVDMEPTEQEKEILRLYGEMEDLLDFTITYHMGEEDVVLDKAVLSGLLLTSEEDPAELLTDDMGHVCFDEEKVIDFVRDMGAEYDTYGKERNFTTCLGENVTIKGGNFGNLLDQDAEVAFLMETLAKGTSAERDPVYAKEGKIAGKEDLGKDYIEINITTQTMYCIKDGKIWLTTDVVTGDKRRKRETPLGAYDVYFKQRNRVLHGGEVPVRVAYWMAVNRGVGIHDAKWRKEFGGDIYINNGSHGCINTPTDAVEQMYEYYPVGTPVLIYETGTAD